MPPKLLATLLLATATLAAQSPAAQPPAAQTPAALSTQAPTPAYDIVSVKLNKTGSGSWSLDSHDGRFSANNISLKDLLVNAFDIRPYLILGIPKAFDSARFDIEAKIVEPDLPALRRLTQEQERGMVLPILTDRFHLKTHTETKTLPVYELVVLPGGPKFKKNPGDGSHGNMSIRNRELTASEMPIEFLAKILSSNVERTVINKTGLTGFYDLTLKWSPEDDPDPQPNSPPALLTALQEQLGLKLRPAKGPVDTLVVDHVEMPSEN